MTIELLLLASQTTEACCRCGTGLLELILFAYSCSQKYSSVSTQIYTLFQESCLLSPFCLFPSQPNVQVQFKKPSRADRAGEAFKSHLFLDGFGRVFPQSQLGCVCQSLLHCQITQQVIALTETKKGIGKREQ